MGRSGLDASRRSLGVRPAPVIAVPSAEAFRGNRRRPRYTLAGRAMMASMVRNSFLLALGAAMCALLPLATFAAESDIVASEKAWAKAVTTRDFDALEKIYADNLIYAHSTGAIESKADYMGKLRQGVARYDAIDHEKTTVEMHGNSAVAHSIVVMRGEAAAGPFNNKLMMIHFWVKDGKDWKLVAHQTTTLEVLK